jgi:hypothetical protein
MSRTKSGRRCLDYSLDLVVVLSTVLDAIDLVSQAADWVRASQWCA